MASEFREPLAYEYRLGDEALVDLRRIFTSLPGGHYRLFLVETDVNLKRQIIDVFVRRERIINPSDRSEGARDRIATD